MRILGAAFPQAVQHITPVMKHWSRSITLLCAHVQMAPITTGLTCEAEALWASHLELIQVGEVVDGLSSDGAKNCVFAI